MGIWSLFIKQDQFNERYSSCKKWDTTLLAFKKIEIKKVKVQIWV